MKKTIVILVGLGLVTGAMAQSPVASYSAPNMVQEINAAFANPPLASNKVYIGQSDNKAAAKAISGLFTTAIDGLTTAEQEEAAVTNVTTSTTTVLTALGTPTTSDAITGFGAHTTAPAITNVTISFETVTGYDSTGAAITNAAGETIAFVTNVTISYDTATAITEIGTPTTAAAITGFGTHTTTSVLDGITLQSRDFVVQP